MVFFQAILTWITRSLGRFFQAAFGWSVVALFGPRPSREKAILSAAVAAAAAWPLLLLGIAVPRVATFLIAFVPLSRSVPSGILRIVWATAAVAVPAVLGLLLAREGRPQAKRSFVLRVAEGFPATLGVACAFLFVAIAAPIRKLVALVRRKVSVHVPVVVSLPAYGELADVVDSTLREAGLELARTPAPLAEDGAVRLLRWIGGPLFRRQLPARLVSFRGSGLSILVSPNGISIVGGASAVNRVRGFLAEALTFSLALQTLDAEAQKIERRLTALVHPDRPREQGPMRATDSLQAIARQLLASDVPWDDFQVLYREMLQAAQLLGWRKPLFEGNRLVGESPRKRTARRR